MGTIVDTSKIFRIMFLTLMNFSRNAGTNKFWKQQMMKRFSYRFWGRARNCMALNIAPTRKSLMKSLWARHSKKILFRTLWTDRIHAACGEHGIEGTLFLEGLARSHISLDRKVLSDLAIYEPRTFQSLVDISKAKLELEGLLEDNVKPAENVNTRGLL